MKLQNVYFWENKTINPSTSFKSQVFTSISLFLLEILNIAITYDRFSGFNSLPMIWSYSRLQYQGHHLRYALSTSGHRQSRKSRKLHWALYPRPYQRSQNEFIFKPLDFNSLPIRSNIFGLLSWAVKFILKTYSTQFHHEYFHFVSPPWIFIWSATMISFSLLDRELS